MLPEILRGFEYDFDQLMQRFEKENSLRFNKFAEIWRDMRFSLIFLGRRPKEDVFFAIEALSYGKSFFFSSKSLLRKVGAIYFLYALYFKQPIMGSAKILTTMDEWIGIKEFIADMKNSSHFDTLYIILKLVLSNAFAFSMTTEKRLTLFAPVQFDNLYEFPPFFDKTKMEKLFDELQNIEGDYETAKTQVAGSYEIPPINYSNANFANLLRDILNKPNVLPSTSKAPDEAGSSRRALRNKGFRRKAKSGLYKSAIFDQVETSDSDISD